MEQQISINEFLYLKKYETEKGVLFHIMLSGVGDDSTSEAIGLANILDGNKWTVAFKGPQQNAALMDFFNWLDGQEISTLDIVLSRVVWDGDAHLRESLAHTFMDCIGELAERDTSRTVKVSAPKEVAGIFRKQSSLMVV